MKRTWHLIGKVAFWLSWPLLFMYIATTRRTRIVVACGDDVLVVRGWLSSGKWSLPGGGLHRGEDPVEGAVRELKEETGVEVNASKLQNLYSGSIKTDHGLRYFAAAFVLELDSKPRLAKQRFELTHLEWANWKELVDNPKTAGDVRSLVLAFYTK